MNRNTWDSTFLEIAFAISKRSPDAQTKCGCVIVNKKNQIISLGFNGFPRNCHDDKLPTTRPDKYNYLILHSEHNAVLNANVPLDNCTAYITGEPCSKCLMILYHVGIVKIIYPKNSPCKPHCVDLNDKKIKKIFLEHCKRKIQIQSIPWVKAS